MLSHVAEARQRAISARADLSIAGLRLNAAVGGSGDAVVLTRPAIIERPETAAALVQEALRSRAELRNAALAVERSETDREAARLALWPRIDVHGGVEFNGGALTDQRSSWVVVAEAHFNLFRGFADVARLAGARHAEIRARADRDALARRIEVDVRAAAAALDAARAREQVGRTALAQAREAQRILRDRYESGLATITDVLRSAEALFDAEARATAAEMDVILQSVALDRAVGRL